MRRRAVAATYTSAARPGRGNLCREIELHAVILELLGQVGVPDEVRRIHAHRFGEDLAAPALAGRPRAMTRPLRKLIPDLQVLSCWCGRRPRFSLMTSAYAIKPLDETTWPAFAALVERNNGIFGGCWCMGFHPEGVGKHATPVINRERKEKHVREGTAHAALVFDGDECLGWCQFGSPEELPRIKNRSAYERAQTTPPDWRIACCYVGKGNRRQGVAAAALAGALDLIAGLGGGTVEGYPEDAASVPAGFLFNGALSTYEKLGFSRDRKIGKHRWVVAKLVEPT
jgi:GNAT superfamily N-acetyltransferase